MLRLKGTLRVVLDVKSRRASLDIRRKNGFWAGLFSVIFLYQLHFRSKINKNTHCALAN